MINAPAPERGALRLAEQAPPRWRVLAPVGLVSLGWVAFIWAWDPAYLTLTVDDAFYYLVIAARAARGEGLTFDGVQPTNGFHPLWLALLTALRAASSSGTPVAMRLVLTAQVGFVAVGVWLLGRALQPSRAAIWLPAAAGAMLLNFYLAKTVVNGQESALLFLLLCATVHATATGRSAFRVGVFAALCGLARLDAVVFGVALAAGQFARHPPGRTRAALAVLVPQLALVGGYLVWSQQHFGHWVPISAAVKAGWAGLGFPGVLGTVVVCGLAYGCGLVGLRRWARGITDGALASTAALAAYGAFVIAQSRLRGSWIPEIWYLSPLLVLAMMGAAWLLPRAARPGAMRIGAGILLAGFLAITTGSWKRRLQPASYQFYLEARSLGEWLAQNTPKQALIAGWDVGIIAAHSERSVANLEGLVGSWAFKERYLDRRAIGAFLDGQGISFLAQPVRLDSLRAPGALRYEGTSIGEWHVAYARCVRFTPAVASAPAGEQVLLVLSRAPIGPTLDEARQTLCRD